MGDRACVAIIENEQVLMVRQTYRGEIIWTFPGGSIEPEETAEAAAIREVHEEIGLDVRIDRCLYHGQRQRASGSYTCFNGTIVGGTLRLGEDMTPDGAAELHEVAWLPLNSLHDNPEVLRALLHAPEGDYNLARPVRVNTLAQSQSNTTMLLENADGRWVWKQYNPLHPPESIDYEHQLLGWLANAGLSFGVPVPLRTRAGGLRTWHDGGWRSLAPYHAGQQCDGQRLDHIALMGRATGELHQALRTYPMTPRPGNVLSATLFDFPPPHIDPCALTPAMLGIPSTREHERICGWYREQAAELRHFSRGTYRTLPQQVCHNDITPNNIVVADGRVHAVLDWEFAGPSARAIDLAMGLRMSMRPWQDPTPWQEVRTFIRGYNTFARLDDAEIAALPLLLRLRTAVPGLWWMGRDSEKVLRSMGYLRMITDWLAHYDGQLIDVVAHA